MSVLVFIEYKNKVSKAALEAVSYGSKIGKVSVVTYGNIDSSELEILGKYGAEKVLVHGDPEIMPLYSDRRRQANSITIINDLKDKIIYTGYVCDESMPFHKKKSHFS